MSKSDEMLDDADKRFTIVHLNGELTFKIRISREIDLHNFPPMPPTLLQHVQIPVRHRRNHAVAAMCPE